MFTILLLNSGQEVFSFVPFLFLLLSIAFLFVVFTYATFIILILGSFDISIICLIFYSIIEEWP